LDIPIALGHGIFDQLGSTEDQLATEATAAWVGQMTRHAHINRNVVVMGLYIIELSGHECHSEAS